MCVSQVVKSYKDEGLWDNTVLVFTTDNGGIGIGNNFPLRGMKVRARYYYITLLCVCS